MASSCRRFCPSIRGYGLLTFLLGKSAFFPGIQKLLSIKTAEKVDQFCDHAGPSGLVLRWLLWPLKGYANSRTQSLSAHI